MSALAINAVGKGKLKLDPCSPVLKCVECGPIIVCRGDVVFLPSVALAHNVSIRFHESLIRLLSIALVGVGQVVQIGGRPAGRGQGRKEGRET